MRTRKSLTRQLIATALAAGLLGLGITSVSADGNRDHDHSAEATSWDEAKATILNHENLIAECMAARGWEYLPYIPADFVLQREEAQARARGEKPVPPSEIDIPVDPNAALVAALSDGDKEARATAYWGDQDTGGTDQGCYKSTYAAAWGVDPFTEEAAGQSARLEAALASDARLDAAENSYGACMSARGVKAASVDAVLVRYMRGSERVSGLERAGGVTPETRAMRQAIVGRWEKEKAVHGACIPGFEKVYNDVIDELRVELGIW